MSIVVEHGYTKETVWECPSCDRTIREREKHLDQAQANPLCPWCTKGDPPPRLVFVRVEWIDLLKWAGPR